MQYDSRPVACNPTIFPSRSRYELLGVTKVDEHCLNASPVVSTLLSPEEECQHLFLTPEGAAFLQLKLDSNDLEAAEVELDALLFRPV